MVMSNKFWFCAPEKDESSFNKPPEIEGSMKLELGNKEDILNKLRNLIIIYQNAIKEIWKNTDPTNAIVLKMTNSKIGLFNKYITTIKDQLAVITTAFYDGKAKETI